MSETDSSRNHVVVLVHGIRDFALWQNTVSRSLEKHGFQVESTNYGRFNLLEFLLPLSYFRSQAISQVINQIRIIKQNNEGAKISVIAHSFGTFVIAQILMKEFDMKFHRVIFCGSVVNYDFPFEQFQGRFLRPIINEVGTRDIWPATAESVTTGYGSAGTYGFHRPLVKDRWHNGAGHGYFLSAIFCEKFWVPLLAKGELVSGAEEPEHTRVWIRILSIIKLKYVLSLFVVLILSWLIASNLDKLKSIFSLSDIEIPDPSVGTVRDLSAALSKIENRILSQRQRSDIASKLTQRLIDTSNDADRTVRRFKNEVIVKTIISLSDRDLSAAWRNLPANLDLSFLDLSSINLSGVKFKRTFMIYTDLTDSNLDDAKFENSWVRNTNFKNASIANTSFPGTDWYNALNVSYNPRDGRPRNFTYWMKCPNEYRASSFTGFIQNFDSLYAVNFGNLRSDEAADLRTNWKSYTRTDSLCDKVQSFR